MVTRDIIAKTHSAFRNVNPDIWTDLSRYVGQVEYGAVALTAQLAAKEKDNVSLERFAAKAIARQVELELECTEYKHKLKAAEAKLAEANDKARLQRALDRIEKAGWYLNLEGSNAEGWTIFMPFEDGGQWDDRSNDLIELVEKAAEQAAQWAESQKEGK